MWACQKALHAISEMTALKQSQLMVKTRRGQRSAVGVVLLECGIAAPHTQVTNFGIPKTIRLVVSTVSMFHKCVLLLKEAARLVNKSTS